VSEVVEVRFVREELTSNDPTERTTYVCWFSDCEDVLYGDQLTIHAETHNAQIIIIDNYPKTNYTDDKQSSEDSKQGS
jgi:hypothetical protein